jgi:hypothetical protein
MVITPEDVEELNAAAIARAAAFVRIAGTVLVGVGAAGCLAWLWTAVRSQQELSPNVGFGLPGSESPQVELVDRIDLLAPFLGAWVLAAFVVGFGLLLRLAADFVLARSGGSVTGFEAGDVLPDDIELD